MLIFLSRWLKGLIAGWLMALMFFIIKRALKKAFGGSVDMGSFDINNPPHARNTPDQQDDTIVETIWAGMPAQQLIKTFGQPQTVTKTGINSEVWVYPIFNGKLEPTEIQIENEAITKWQTTPKQDDKQISQY